MKGRAKTLPSPLWLAIHGSHPSGRRYATLKMAPGHFSLQLAAASPQFRNDRRQRLGRVRGLADRAADHQIV
ncbi:hypothetical protein DNJ95_09510 [Stutzerimonas kirkiae]|uniref:Uncharacterized protein n=1 Tax=Stutzerimonas kirkiae TaxID=2211392 RepID=A0A4V2KDA0_9GAMM|nr:hypothetical protein DNJ96_06920 [Stutzerimonas kirkiae]TBV02334.1 hypothetical protein DNJ95_09510 [Stutzerimonas kirkiae]TBV14645.1 hypothetical protein DNK01_08790 [Stutzerimonas kirkiae]